MLSGPGSEECNPLNMSIEAELVIEQMKEQHHRDLCHLRLELEDKVSPESQSDPESCQRVGGPAAFSSQTSTPCAFLLEFRGCQEPISSG